MATTLQTCVDISRRHLLETTAKFWTDAELVALANRGIRDLWRAINDLYQDYFLTIDATNVSQAANTSTLTGVPADVGVVRAIEPRTLSSYPDLFYKPKNYTHSDFAAARALTAQDPNFGGIVWWHVTGAGAPVGAPTIHVAPQLNAAVLLRLVYVPTLTELVIGNNNPIPGESDNAVIAWIMAYALAKQVAEGQPPTPDEKWLSIYGTEKDNILTSLTPRQTDEPEIAEGLFEGGLYDY